MFLASIAWGATEDISLSEMSQIFAMERFPRIQFTSLEFTTNTWWNRDSTLLNVCFGIFSLQQCTALVASIIFNSALYKKQCEYVGC